MARRGRFGRLPRPAPSLSNTIVSIAREMQNQRDSNLIDAWKKGGEFEGQPATDEMVLDHWRGRLKDISPKDPLYDTYKNTVFQFEYSISESKIATSYAQGRTSDAQMAQFYLGWAKKVPVNSEFYRVLQRDAAQFMRASRARGTSRMRAAADGSYNDAQASTRRQYEATGAYLTDVLTNMAKAHRLIGMKGEEDLQDFSPADPGEMLELLRSINGSTSLRNVPDEGLQRVTDTANYLYRDPLTGQPVYASDVLKTLKTLDPNFTGNVSVDYYAQALRQQMQGQAIRYERAAANGKKSDMNAAEKEWKKTSETGREAEAWPIQEAYQHLREGFLRTWSNTTSSPTEKLDAFKDYQDGLLKLANNPMRLPDDSTRAALIAEATGDGNVQSLAENFTGLLAGETDTEGAERFRGDIADTWVDVQRYQTMAEQVASGQAVWAMGSTHGDTFVPGAGTEIGATTEPPPPTAIPLFLPQGRGDEALQVWVQGKPVTVSVVDSEGFGVSPVNPNAAQVGMAYDVMVNGQRQRLYSYQRGNVTYYTKDPPWSENVQVSSTADSVNVTLRLGGTATADNVTGNPYFNVTTNQNGTASITVDAAQLLLNSDPERVRAGVDLTTDSLSPTIALLTGTSEGQKTLKSLSKDDQFLRNTDYFIRAGSGQTLGPDGIWQGGDPATLQRNQTQVAIVTNPATPQEVVAFIGDLWDRVTTLGIFNQRSPAEKQIMNASGGPDDRMPADKALNTSFGSLAGTFVSGTAGLSRAEMAKGGLALTAQGQIRVPSVPEIMVKPITGPATIPQAPIVTPAPAPLPTAPLVTPITGPATLPTSGTSTGGFSESGKDDTYVPPTTKTRSGGGYRGYIPS